MTSVVKLQAIPELPKIKGGLLDNLEKLLLKLEPDLCGGKTEDVDLEEGNSYYYGDEIHGDHYVETDMVNAYIQVKHDFSETYSISGHNSGLSYHNLTYRIWAEDGIVSKIVCFYATDWDCFAYIPYPDTQILSWTLEIDETKKSIVKYYRQVKVCDHEDEEYFEELLDVLGYYSDHSIGNRNVPSGFDKYSYMTEEYDSLGNKIHVG